MATQQLSNFDNVRQLSNFDNGQCTSLDTSQVTTLVCKVICGRGCGCGNEDDCSRSQGRGMAEAEEEEEISEEARLR